MVLVKRETANKIEANQYSGPYVIRMLDATNILLKTPKGLEIVYKNRVKKNLPTMFLSQ